MILPIYEIAFDCFDPHRVAAFWRAALEYEQDMPTAKELDAAYAAHPEWRDIAIVEDKLARHPRLYLQRVAEPKRDRNRLTFDVVLPQSTIERLDGLGAMKLDAEWFGDVEGNEFRVRQGDGPPRFHAVVIDALDPSRMARFWGQTLGFSVTSDRCDPPEMHCEAGELIVAGRRLGIRVPGHGTPPDGRVHQFTPGLEFRSTIEPKVAKNRIHFDLIPTAVEQDRAETFARGAKPEDIARTGHRGMFDPEGNEFCLHTDEMFA